MLSPINKKRPIFRAVGVFLGYKNSPYGSRGCVFYSFPSPNGTKKEVKGTIWTFCFFLIFGAFYCFSPLFIGFFGLFYLLFILDILFYPLYLNFLCKFAVRNLEEKFVLIATSIKNAKTEILFLVSLFRLCGFYKF